MPRRFEWCPNKQNCTLVGRGKCDGHPNCNNGIKCRFLKTRSCSYYHPHFHFEISPNHKNRYNESINKNKRTHKRHARHRRHSNGKSTSNSISPLRQTFVKAKNTLNEPLNKPWTASDEKTLIAFFNKNNNVITSVEKMDEIKKRLNRNLLDIKTCLIRLKSEGKYNIIKSEPVIKNEFKPWRQWEENYLKTFVITHNITDYFPSDKAEDIKKALDRKLCDINLTLIKLRKEGKIPNINANIKLKNRKRTFSEMNKNIEHKMNENCSNGNNESKSDDTCTNSNNSINRKRKRSEIIEHNNETESDENTIITIDTNSNNSITKRKYSNSGIIEHKNNETESNEIQSLEMSLKNELEKSVNLLSNMRIPNDVKYKNNYIELLEKHMKCIKECNNDMYKHQNVNTRAKYGDIVRARNSRGHIRKKQKK